MVRKKKKNKINDSLSEFVLFMHIDKFRPVLLAVQSSADQLVDNNYYIY